MSLRLTIFCGLVGMLGAIAVSPASAASLYPPGGFRLSASNGYNLHAIAFDGDPHERPDALLLFFDRKGSSVLYGVRKKVEVSESSIAADIGGLGSIDLEFVPSGQPRTETSVCDRRPFEFDSGFYEGRIEFEGEEGFTKVDAVRAPGELRFGVSLICSSGSAVEGLGGHAPGALLSLRRKSSRGGLEFGVKTNSPTRPTRFSASIDERRDGLGIFRSVNTVAGPEAFRFDVPHQIAVLNPPSPFQGTATFHRTSRSPGHLGGSLSVDFPGRSNVHLAGSRGSLVRYVDHPKHPFRLFP